MEVREDGPRLRYDDDRRILGRRDGEVLVGGLGALGVGRMWVPETEAHRADPTYADAPYISDTSGERN